MLIRPRTENLRWRLLLAAAAFGFSAGCESQVKMTTLPNAQSGAVQPLSTPDTSVPGAASSENPAAGAGTSNNSEAALSLAAASLVRSGVNKVTVSWPSAEAGATYRVYSASSDLGDDISVWESSGTSHGPAGAGDTAATSLLSMDVFTARIDAPTYIKVVAVRASGTKLGYQSLVVASNAPANDLSGLMPTRYFKSTWSFVSTVHGSDRTFKVMCASVSCSLWRVNDDASHSYVDELPYITNGLLHLDAIKIGSYYYFPWKGLIKTDGLTAIGTTVLKEYQSIGNLVYNGTYLVYSAKVDGSSEGTSVWRSDGTAIGTILLKDPHTASTSHTIEDFIRVGSTDKVFFISDSDGESTEPWVTDGTVSGTKMLLAIKAGTTAGAITKIPAVGIGDKVYFVGQNEGGAGSEHLWESDGTTAGTRRISDVWKTTDIFAIGGKVIFHSDMSNSTRGLYYYDPADPHNGSCVANSKIVPTNGPGCIKKIYDSNGATRSNMRTDHLIKDGEALLLLAKPNNEIHIFKTDGTSAGTVQMTSQALPNLGSGTTDPRAFPYSPNALAYVHDSSRSVATGGVHGVNFLGTETFLFDIHYGSGTSQLPPDLTTSTSDPNRNYIETGGYAEYDTRRITFDRWQSQVLDYTRDRLFAAGGFAYFMSMDFGGNPKLYATNGTVVTDLNVSHTGASGMEGLVRGPGGKVFFAGDRGTGDAELWATDGSLAGTNLVKDVRAGAGSSCPWCKQFVFYEGAQQGGDYLYFPASDTNEAGQTLWRSDGTTGGTVKIHDTSVPSISDIGTMPLSAGTKLYFTSNTSGTGDPGLFVVEGTGVPAQVKEHDLADTVSGDIVSLLAQPSEGSIVYRAYDGTSHNYYFTNGTPGNSEKWTAGVSVTHPVGLSTSLMVMYANDGTSTGLWRSNYTSAGTTFISAACTASPTSSGVVLGSRAFYICGGEVVLSDGYTAEAIDFGNGITSVQSVTGINSTHFLIRAYSPSYGSEYWISDGTAEGTALLFESAPGPASMLSDASNVAISTTHIFIPVTTFEGSFRIASIPIP